MVIKHYLVLWVVQLSRKLWGVIVWTAINEWQFFFSLKESWWNVSRAREEKTLCLSLGVIFYFGACCFSSCERFWFDSCSTRMVRLLLNMLSPDSRRASFEVPGKATLQLITSTLLKLGFQGLLLPFRHSTQHLASSTPKASEIFAKLRSVSPITNILTEAANFYQSWKWFH